MDEEALKFHPDDLSEDSKVTDAEKKPDNRKESSDWIESVINYLNQHPFLKDRKSHISEIIDVIQQAVENRSINRVLFGLEPLPDQKKLRILVNHLVKGEYAEEKLADYVDAWIAKHKPEIEKDEAIQAAKIKKIQENIFQIVDGKPKIKELDGVSKKRKTDIDLDDNFFDRPAEDSDRPSAYDKNSLKRTFSSLGGENIFDDGNDKKEPKKGKIKRFFKWLGIVTGLAATGVGVGVEIGHSIVDKEKHNPNDTTENQPQSPENIADAKESASHFEDILFVPEEKTDVATIAKIPVEEKNTDAEVEQRDVSTPVDSTPPYVVGQDDTFKDVMEGFFGTDTSESDEAHKKLIAGKIEIINKTGRKLSKDHIEKGYVVTPEFRPGTKELVSVTVTFEKNKNETIRTDKKPEKGEAKSVKGEKRHYKKLLREEREKTKLLPIDKPTAAKGPTTFVDTPSKLPKSIAERLAKEGGLGLKPNIAKPVEEKPEILGTQKREVKPATTFGPDKNIIDFEDESVDLDISADEVESSSFNPGNNRTDKKDEHENVLSPTYKKVNAERERQQFLDAKNRSLTATLAERSKEPELPKTKRVYNPNTRKIEIVPISTPIAEVTRRPSPDSTLEIDQTSVQRTSSFEKTADLGKANGGATEEDMKFVLDVTNLTAGLSTEEKAPDEMTTPSAIGKDRRIDMVKNMVDKLTIDDWIRIGKMAVTQFENMDAGDGAKANNFLKSYDYRNLKRANIDEEMQKNYEHLKALEKYLNNGLGLNLSKMLKGNRTTVLKSAMASSRLLGTWVEMVKFPGVDTTNLLDWHNYDEWKKSHKISKNTPDLTPTDIDWFKKGEAGQARNLTAAELAQAEELEKIEKKFKKDETDEE